MPPRGIGWIFLEIGGSKKIGSTIFLFGNINKVDCLKKIYFLNSFSTSLIGSQSSPENKSNPWSSSITGLPNIRISTTLIGAEAQSSATSRPPEHTEWQIFAHLIILADFVISKTDAALTWRKCKRRFLRRFTLSDPWILA